VNLASWIVAPAVVVAGLAGFAHAEKWIGVANSDNGPTPRIVIKGPVTTEADGSVTLAGHYRCIGQCVAHRGTVSANLSNTADGVGHETVEIDLPNGIVCTSDADLEGAFDALPPTVGTALPVDYECDDANGDVVDTGTMDVTRRR
jgi:hypothetical protein